MSTEDKGIDEHLAKFPPFKGPRIGGNFEVDENVLLGKQLIRKFSTLRELMLAVISAADPLHSG
jgi:hypothetical protein